VIEPLTYGSVCSGMEAATLAWKPLGWKCAFVSEIEKAPCALLKERFPDVPNHGDMTKFEDWPDHAIDLLAGGTPCQSFSVAGLRRGLTDPRGSLMLTYGAIAQRYRPTWLFWENVPGVLSSNEGRDFGAFLGMLAELGYGFAYRVLDAQFFGLAQRRARVFVVGYLGDWRPPAAVLFERESLRGDSAPRREAGEGATYAVAPSLTGSGRGVERPGESRGQDPLVAIAHSLRADGFDASEDGTGRGTPLIAFDTTQITSATNRSQPRAGEPCHPVTAEGHAPAIAFSCKDHGADAGELAPTLRAMGHDGSHANAGGQAAIAYTIHGTDKTVSTATQTELAGSLRTKPPGSIENSSTTVVAEEWAVRRLTPRECERLQGAPDDHTLITYRKKPMADGPRYKMIGNSWAVPCVRWIGERIALVDARLKAASWEAESDG